MELLEVRGRRAGGDPGTPQLDRARGDVHLLPAVGAGAEVSEVLVVEEIRD